MNHFSPILIITTHNNVNILNQNNGEIPSSGVIDPETINPHDLCNQCSKHRTDCLFGKLRIRGFNDEPHFTPKNKLMSSPIQINTLFKTDDKRKRRRCDKIIHKAIRVTAEIHKTNKNSVLQSNQKMHVNWNLRIIFGDHFLTNHSLTF